MTFSVLYMVHSPFAPYIFHQFAYFATQIDSIFIKNCASLFDNLICSINPRGLEYISSSMLPHEISSMQVGQCHTFTGMLTHMLCYLQFEKGTKILYDRKFQIKLFFYLLNGSRSRFIVFRR